MVRRYDVVRTDSVIRSPDELGKWPIETGTAAFVVTSPPFWSRRRYGDHPDEFGGETLAEYLYRLVLTMNEARRVLDDEGVLWLNLGDSAAKSGGSGGDYNRGGSKAGRRKYRHGGSHLPGGQYAAVPYRAAVLLQEDGWYLRATIPWDKGAVSRPEDPKHARRPLEQHEYVFMLTKNGTAHRFSEDGLRSIGLGNVWAFPADRRKTGHEAPYPPELPLRCLTVSGAAPGDLVVDPFHGSGTTGEVARSLGCDYVGLDLYHGRVAS